MNYKLKCRNYFFSFILSALIYYQVEYSEHSEKNNLPELTLEQSQEVPGKKQAVL